MKWCCIFKSMRNEIAIGKSNRNISGRWEFGDKFDAIHVCVCLSGAQCIPNSPANKNHEHTFELYFVCVCVSTYNIKY